MYNYRLSTVIHIKCNTCTIMIINVYKLAKFHDRSVNKSAKCHDNIDTKFIRKTITINIQIFMSQFN